MNFKNKKVLIMGLGTIGKGLKDALFFYNSGAQVTVTDLKSREALKKSVDVLNKYPEIILHLEKHLESDFIENEIIVRNPAIPQNSKFLKIARENNNKVIMEDSFGVLNTKATVIGVTGTRGKTTTATLIYEVLKRAGKDVYLSGNVRGTATLPLLEKLNENSFLVLELSSFQLQGFRDEKVSPKYSLITNISPDHLNYSDGMDGYVDDKKNIYKFQNEGDFLFIDSENTDKYHQEFKNEANSNLIYFSKTEVADYKRNLLGDHNLSNIAGVRALTLKLGISENVIKETVAEFQAVEFRLQKIREINGITFINDAASTSPIAGVKALNSFLLRKAILIAGGATKGLPLDEWASTIVQKAKKVILLQGTETAGLKKLIIENGGEDLILEVFDNFKEAIKRSWQEAEDGDFVLLSPGAASFGMFKNEFDRADQFDEIVKSL